LLGPTARVPTLQASAYDAIINAPGDPPRAAVTATFLLIVTLCGFYAYHRLLKRPGRYVTISGRGFRQLRFDIRKWRYPMTAIVIIYVMIAVILPYLAIAYAAFQPFLLPKISFSTFTLINFRKLFSDSNVIVALENSLILVIIGSAVIAAGASLIGYLTSRHRGRATRALEAVSLLPLAIPGLSFALGMLWTVLQLQVAGDYLYGTLLLIFLTQFASFLPLAMQIISSSVTQIGPEMEEAARVSGAPSYARIHKIMLPLMWPTIASVWLILALHVSTEAGLSIFLFTSSSITLAVSVFFNAEIGSASLTYAGALILASFGLLTIIVGQWAFGTGDALARRENLTQPEYKPRADNRGTEQMTGLRP
jgi:iron(III) transport system permease protein